MFQPAAVLALEIAPFSGHTYGGEFEDSVTGDRYRISDSASYGILINIEDVPGEQLEFFASRQHTNLSSIGLFTARPLFDMTISYLHVGGLYFLPDYQRVRPFVSGTLGLTSMAPRDTSLTNETHPSMSIGLGMKYFASRNLGLRVDLRGIYTMLESNSAIFCSGGCTVHVRGSGFVQTSISTAAIWRF
jgi:hypothetical protein